MKYIREKLNEEIGMKKRDDIEIIGTRLKKKEGNNNKFVFRKNSNKSRRRRSGRRRRRSRRRWRRLGRS